MFSPISGEKVSFMLTAPMSYIELGTYWPVVVFCMKPSPLPIHSTHEL